MTNYSPLHSQFHLQSNYIPLHHAKYLAYVISKVFTLLFLDPQLPPVWNALPSVYSLIIFFKFSLQLFRHINIFNITLLQLIWDTNIFKAFDVVPQCTLFSKLEIFEFDRYTIRWTRNKLWDCTQRVVHGSVSGWRSMISALPQG